jgi:hypothetical protein
MTLLEIAYQRRKAKAEAAGLLDAAVLEVRTLNIPEQVRFDLLTARIAELDAAAIERAALRKLAE